MINLNYTPHDIIKVALSKVGVDPDNTESKNIEDALRNLNLMVQMWSADPDLAIQRVIPLAGFATLSETIDAPPEYCTAMALNLALILAPDYDQQPDKTLISMAAYALESIKTFNIRRQTASIPPNTSVVL